MLLFGSRSTTIEHPLSDCCRKQSIRATFRCPSVREVDTAIVARGGAGEHEIQASVVIWGFSRTGPGSVMDGRSQVSGICEILPTSTNTPTSSSTRTLGSFSGCWRQGMKDSSDHILRKRRSTSPFSLQRRLGLSTLHARTIFVQFGNLTPTRNWAGLRLEV